MFVLNREKLFFYINLITSLKFYLLVLFDHLLKLSSVRKVLETIMFLALGIIETLGSIISHGTSSKFADVRSHLWKVSKMTLSLICYTLTRVCLLSNHVFDAVGGVG